MDVPTLGIFMEFHLAALLYLPSDLQAKQWAHVLERINYSTEQLSTAPEKDLWLSFGTDLLICRNDIQLVDC